MRDRFGIPGTAQVRTHHLETHDEVQQRLLERVNHHGKLAAAALLDMQKEEGFWCGDLTGDSTLLSDYILLEMWLHPPQPGKEWNPPHPEKIKKMVRSIWRHQLPDGGWNLFAKGPAEINPTVRAYTALKLVGEDPEDPRMQKARELILELGGIQACNSYTKINLSLFGLFPKKYVPTVPPEILLIPGNFLYEMSSWTRTIIVPLSIIQALNIQCPAPRGINVDELLHPKAKLRLPRKDRLSEIFIHADRLLKQWERRHVPVVRTKAIRAAERWMMEHIQYSDGLGAIYPAMMYSIMAMDAMGYERDQPDLVKAIEQFEDLILDQGEIYHFQPCKSPLWDTAIAAFSLGELGIGETEKLTRAADWMLTKEVRRKGDWSEKRPNLTPSGWAFEFANEFYPDIDDTAMVLLALQHARASDPEKQEKAEKRAINWLLGMQSSDGGWAAFDVDNNWQILNKVPFADHNAMLDPTCADITGRVMDALCRRGMSHNDEVIHRGVRYLLTTQEKDGPWYGRWGVNYIYGTFLALRGLRASGDPAAHESMKRAASWYYSVQNPDGGWGESCMGYQTGGFVTAESTASQTAWALLGLLAAEGTLTPKAKAGIQWLMDRQKPDGTWDEELTTGTGFPNVFYLTYHLYRNYFPLMAMAAYKKISEKQEGALRLGLTPNLSTQ